MPAFGDYQSIKEVGESYEARIYSAVSLSRPGDGKFAVKVRRFADAELNAAAFESARVQKSAAEFGGKHLAPILDLGITEDELPWYVTRLYDHSLATFLKGRNTADAALLQRIADNILSGLEEFQRAAPRPHGNLKLSNVLLDGDDLRTLRAVLADPASEPQEINSAEDLFALGSIIYQIVRRTTRPQVLLPPLDWTSDWDNFGRPWLDFTNRLLDRQANEAPGVIGELRGQLRKLGSSSQVSQAPRPYSGRP